MSAPNSAAACPAAGAAAAAVAERLIPASNRAEPSCCSPRYDCEVVQRGSSLFMHFEGYPSDEDEPLHSLDSIRFSSLAAEPDDCPKVRLGN